ncbi:tripartite tricarboxylate transporter substrate binding protein [Phreatobacter stygius]|uniref:Tripartite tricarboxylate transporter substrate binding protein n=1 Tax=Phreatobacter stygius TaxID=1940610 RepID=A0A4D7B5H6_9HYPH|nr:tripartite tricarboxylate transporter substrate binding protein [Phreatobacter stygius]QCI66395.1 tripartite tricarboxylate transporter substrate binding protein [Phreatobacter stygius]
MTSSLIRAATALFAMLTIVTTAASQPYPAGPVRLVVPYAAGGPTDAFARLLVEAWNPSMDGRVYVENKAGGGTVIGTDAVAKAAPDGQTLLLTTVAHAVNVGLYASLPYDTTRDFMPVALLARAPLVLLVNNRSPVTTPAEFIAYVRANRGKLTYGSAGNGSAPHVAQELLNHMAGLQLIHVPYRGNGPALSDLLGGHIDFLFDSAATGLAAARGGGLRLVATSMANRLPQTPDTPALAEAVPGYEAYTWNALFAPAGTPQPVIDKLIATLSVALANPSLQAKALDMGLLLEARPTPQDLARHLSGEIAKWGALIVAAKIKVE